MDDKNLILDEELENDSILSSSYENEFEADDVNNIDITSVFVKEIGEYKVFTKEEETKIFREYKANPTKELKDEIANHNMKLVLNIASKYNKMTTHLELLDLVSLGSMGLLKAIDLFDIEKGYKFSTYATWWIRQSITRGIADSEHTVRFQVHMHELVLKYNRLINEYYNANGKKPDDKYLQKELKLSKEQFEDLKDSIEFRKITSLNTQIGESEHGEEQELLMFIEDEKTESPEQVAERHELENIIQKYLDEYLMFACPRSNQQDRREQLRILITHRYGLMGTELWTLEECGSKMGISRERARQLQNKFLKWMSHPNRKRVLTHFL